MADKGTWLLCASKASEIVFINAGPSSSVLAIYRIHNNGPCAVSIGIGGVVHVDPNTDVDVATSGSQIVVNLAGAPQCGPRPHGAGPCDDASGTYELLCCEAPAQIGTPAAPPANGGAG